MADDVRPFTVQEINDEMGRHFRVLDAPDRVAISVDLIRGSELIEVFLAFPGGYVYRVDPLEISDDEVWEATKVDVNLNKHYRYVGK